MTLAMKQPKWTQLSVYNSVPRTTYKSDNEDMYTVPDLPLCLGVLKHRIPLAGGPIFLPKIFFYDGFLLMRSNFEIEGVLFRSDSRHNDRVDCLCRPTGPSSFRAQVRGLITQPAQGLICPKSGTACTIRCDFYSFIDVCLFMVCLCIIFALTNILIISSLFCRYL